MKEQNINQVSRGISILIVLLICLIVSFCVSFFGYFYIFPSIEKKYMYVKVPDLKNLTVKQATSKLLDLGLKIEIASEEETASFPEGVIIYQQPIAKSFAKKNSVVYVIVAKEKKSVRVPDVKGKILEEAKKILMDAGLDIGEVKEEEAEEVEKGFVISSEPRGNSEVEKGTKIILKVSKGKKIPLEKVKVPNIVNKSLIEAKNILERNGLLLGNVKKVCDEDKEFDIIISQTPKAGSIVVKGSRVNVVLNVEEK